MTALEEFQKEAAKNFLNSVLIVDDKISFDISPQPASKLKTPDNEFGDIQSETEDKVPFVGRSELNAKELITTFSSENILCTPYLYEKDKPFPYSLAKKSDIIVLDWDLDGDEKTIQKILTEILKNNLSKMWYVVIYTSCNLDEVTEKLIKQKFSEKIEFVSKNGNELNYKLNNNEHISGRIDVIKKCDDSELSKKLVEGFSKFSNGFINSIALKVVTSVRNKTYNLLGTYHNALDNAVVTHYLNLLLNKDTCRQAKYNLFHYILSLIISDIGDIVKEDLDGEISLINSVSELLNDKKSLYINSEEHKTKQNKSISELLEGIELSEDNIDKFLQDSFDGISCNDIKFKAISLSVDNKFEKELACIDSTKKCFNNGGNHELKYGSVIKNDHNDYLLCIQPLCDCERLKNNTAFLFIKLSADKKNFSFVIKDNSELKYLRTSSELSKTFMSETFTPSTLTKNIQSNGNSFKNKEKKEFKWICDLKAEYVQKVIHEISATYTRIGMDQFEWLRKKSKGKI